jgi:hypothetical protein
LVDAASTAVGMRSSSLLFTLFRGCAAVTSPRDRAQTVGGDCAAGFFAEAVRSVLDPLERTIDLKAFVILFRELGPKQITIEMFLRGIRQIHAAKFDRRGDFLRMLRMSPGKLIAKMNERTAVPGPLGRNDLGDG